MFTLRNIRIGGHGIAGVVLMLALAPAGMCQTTTVEESEPTTSDTTEEIVVYGKRSIFQLRQEVYKAEEKFFAAFNALNSNDKFDVDCNYVWRIEARRRVRECTANFLKKYKRDLAIGWNPNLAALRKNEKLLVEEMRTQVSEHPELLEVFAEMAKAKQNYDSERQSRRP